MSKRGPPPPPKRGRDDSKTHVSLQAGTVIAGKVRLERMLSQGGMGSVWRAHHLSLEVPVAVKFLQHAWAAADDTLTRFGREAKAAAQIRSSNVVQVLDHGIDRGSPYIIMELLDGEDLSMRLRRERRLPLDEVAYIVRNVARGLQIAHDAGLVHRDLKPQNIFLAREGDVTIPKILDFGIAKQLPRTSMPAGSDTRDGQLLGTPFYMSPEQARGRTNIDHRSDLWALGVTAYRALVGKKPFDAEVIGDVIVQICSDPIPRASELAPELPPAIDDFFATALARPVEERFQSARDLAVALDAIAGHVSASGDRLALPARPPQGAASLHPTPPSMGGMHHTPKSLHASWGDAETAARQTASRRAWLIIGGGALAVVALMSWAIGRLSAIDDGVERGEVPGAAPADATPSADTGEATGSEDDTPAEEAEPEDEDAPEAPASASASATSEARPPVHPKAVPRPTAPKTKKKHRDVGY